MRLGSLVVSLFGSLLDSSFGSFLGSHRPSVLSTSVPVEEWDYYHTGKCSLFVQLYILKVILSILS